MADKELKLNKRKKNALLSSLEKNIFNALDASLSGGDELSPDESADLASMLKTIDESVVELKAFNDKIFELTDDDNELEKDMSDDMTLKIRINKYRARVEAAIKV